MRTLEHLKNQQAIFVNHIQELRTKNYHDRYWIETCQKLMQNYRGMITFIETLILDKEFLLLSKKLDK